MEELTIEQKAKAYDEVRKKIALRFGSNVAEEVFSEFEESEDERVRKELLLDIPKVFSYDKAFRYIAYLKKQGEQKPWSEEDEQIFNVMKSELEKYIMLKQYGTPLSVYDMEWFKSLKDRVLPQLQQKWSVEDCNEIETIACHLDNTDNEDMADVLRNIRDKYCHIIPQSTWKPSDEQITWLYRAADMSDKDSRMKQVLNELLEQLKKLRG